MTDGRHDNPGRPPMAERMSRLPPVNCPAELHEAAKERAEVDGVSLAELIRQGLQREVARRDRQTGRSR